MSRISLIEIIQRREIDLTAEYVKLDTAICKMNDHYTSINGVFEKCFCQWRFRGNYLSLHELRDSLGLHVKKFKSEYGLTNRISENGFFLFCELVASLGSAFDDDIVESNLEYEFDTIYQTIVLDLAKIGYELKLLSEEHYIVTETNPAATAVSEIVEPELSDKIIEYNHYLLRGDLAKKREILRAFAHKFEAINPALKQCNASLEDKASYLLNTINIRHNNKERSSKYYKPFVEKMSDIDLERWYDETYQTLLFAFLSVDQVSRNQAIDELKTKISEAK